MVEVEVFSIVMLSVVSKCGVVIVVLISRLKLSVWFSSMNC